MRDWQNINSSRLCGFSIVELLAAVAIVGVIATLALPRYRSQVARSRQAEAKTNLGTIHKLQKIYATESELDFSPPRTPARHAGLNYGIDKCGDTASESLNGLGFRLTECSKSRYRYITDGGNDCAQSDGSLDQGKVYPGCTANDVWHMSNIGKLTHTHDVIKSCPGGSSPSSGCGATTLPPSPPVTPPPSCTNTCPTGYTLEADCSCTPPTPPSPPITPPPSCTNTCPTGYTLEADCSCTPPTPPPSCPIPACSLGGNWVDGTHPNCCVCSLTTCSAGETLNTSTCSCDSTTCDTDTQCCDGSAPKTKPSSLTCYDWKGTWSSTANNKGCCKCDSGKTFSFDISTNKGACCRSGLFFTNGVCAQVCNVGCCDPLSECCEPGNHEVTCDPDEYLDGVGYKPADCGCKACDKKYACRTDEFKVYLEWDDANQKCNIKSTYQNADLYTWEYNPGSCKGYWIKKCDEVCDRSSKCCVNDNYEVPSASDTGLLLSCDDWHGDWDSSPNTKGCCICNAGKTFSYDSGSESGSCCPTGLSWNGIACEGSP